MQLLSSNLDGSFYKLDSLGNMNAVTQKDVQSFLDRPRSAQVLALYRNRRPYTQDTLTTVMTMGKLLTLIGALILVLGLVITYTPWLVNWFGNLPGDIRIEGENSKVFIPITSMIIVSVVGTVVINLVLRR